MNIHVHIQGQDDVLAQINKKLDDVLAALKPIQIIIGKEANLMPTIDQVLADVEAEKDQISSISALITGLRKQVADALATSGGIPADVQSKIDAVFADAEANKAALAAALQAQPDTNPAPSSGT